MIWPTWFFGSRRKVVTAEIDAALSERMRASDIPVGSDVYSEIETALSSFRLNLAFFAFASRANSHCARTLKDGQCQAFPCLTLCLKHDEDYRRTGIPLHQGNWHDKGKLTEPIRNVLNAILRKHNYDDQYVSDDTFIFVDSRERIVFDELGRASKDIVRKLVRREAPRLKVANVYWSSTRLYHVILQHRADYKRVKRTLPGRIAQSLPAALAARDEHHYCRSYEVAIKLGHTDMNLFHLAREG